MATRTKNPRGSIDWQSIEHEYVTGGDDVSLRHLAKKHEIHQTTMCNVSARDGWVAKRTAYREQVAERALEASIEDRAETLAERNAHLGERLYTVATTAIEDALFAEKPSARQSNMVSAGIAIDKWRLVTGQNTAKTEQTIKGPHDDLTDTEAEALLAESVDVLLYSKQRRAAATGRHLATAGAEGQP